MSPRYAPDIEALLGPAGGKDLAMGGGYEGANRFSRELALYQPALRSANADIVGDKDMSDARSRDMVRNDAFVQGGEALWKDSIVGSRYALNSKPELTVLQRQDKRLDETWETEFQEEVESLFSLAAESPDCLLDAGGTMTFTDMVRLQIGVNLYGGEGLSTVEWIRAAGRPFKTAIQCVEIDRLSTPPTESANPDVVQGIKLGPTYNDPIGYYIRSGHPSDVMRATDAYRWDYVPARKPWGRHQVIHLKETRRPSQVRAISELTAGIAELRTTRSFRKVLMQNAIVNASYAASIESELPTEQIMATIGAGDRDATIASATIDWATQYLQAIDLYSAGAKNLAIDGVKLPHLFPGSKLQLRPMGTPGGIGTDFEASLLRYLAASLGMSYEQLSRDYSKSNYSSIRAAMTETWKFMQSKKKAIADRFATIVYWLWLEEALNTGLITSMPRNVQSTANYYEGLNKAAYGGCDWIGAARGQIDELKETQAAVLRLSNNLTTLEDEHARFGMDWRKQLRQRKREMDLLRTYDLLMPEQDPNMMNAAQGTEREASEPRGGGNDD